MTAKRRLRALIVQHEQPTPPGRIRDWLAEHVGMAGANASIRV